MGSIKVSGKAQIYFRDTGLLEKFLAHTYTTLSFKLQDNAGNGYLIQIPKVSFQERDADDLGWHRHRS